MQAKEVLAASLRLFQSYSLIVPLLSAIEGFGLSWLGFYSWVEARGGYLPFILLVLEIVLAKVFTCWQTIEGQFVEQFGFTKDALF